VLGREKSLDLKGEKTHRPNQKRSGKRSPKQKKRHTKRSLLRSEYGIRKQKANIQSRSVRTVTGKRRGKGPGSVRFSREQRVPQGGRRGQSRLKCDGEDLGEAGEKRSLSKYGQPGNLPGRGRGKKKECKETRGGRISATTDSDGGERKKGWEGNAVPEMGGKKNPSTKHCQLGRKDRKRLGTRNRGLKRYLTVVREKRERTPAIEDLPPPNKTRSGLPLRARKEEKTQRRGRPRPNAGSRN